MAALMLGGDKARGYCLEMICADFLAGANLEGRELTSVGDRPHESELATGQIADFEITS